MYERLFNISAAPFPLTPDLKAFFGAHIGSRAVSQVVHGLVQQQGVFVVTGEIGAGKATFV